MSSDVARRAVDTAISEVGSGMKKPNPLPFPLALPPPGYTAPGSRRDDGRMTSDLKRMEKTAAWEAEDEGIWKVRRNDVHAGGALEFSPSVQGGGQRKATPCAGPDCDPAPLPPTLRASTDLPSSPPPLR